MKMLLIFCYVDRRFGLDSLTFKHPETNFYACRAVFFNLFSAVESSANVCVAYGTLCNDLSVYPTDCNKPNR